MKKFARTLLGCVAVMLAVACTSPADVAEAQLVQIVEKNEAVGLAVAVVRDGEMVYTGTFGYKDWENKVFANILCESVECLYRNFIVE